MKYREIISYKDYFEDFFNAQEPKGTEENHQNT